MKDLALPWPHVGNSLQKEVNEKIPILLSLNCRYGCGAPITVCACLGNLIHLKQGESWNKTFLHVVACSANTDASMQIRIFAAWSVHIIVVDSHTKCIILKSTIFLHQSITRSKFRKHSLLIKLFLDPHWGLSFSFESCLTFCSILDIQRDERLTFGEVHTSTSQLACIWCSEMDRGMKLAGLVEGCGWSSGLKTIKKLFNAFVWY